MVDITEQDQQAQVIAQQPVYHNRILLPDNNHRLEPKHNPVFNKLFRIYQRLTSHLDRYFRLLKLLHLLFQDNLIYHRSSLTIRLCLRTYLTIWQCFSLSYLNNCLDLRYNSHQLKFNQVCRRSNRLFPELLRVSRRHNRLYPKRVPHPNNRPIRPRSLKSKKKRRTKK